MNKIKKFINLKLFTFSLLLSLGYGLGFTFAEFYDSPMDSFYDFIVLAMQWSIVVFATFGLIYLLSVNRWIFALTFPPLTVCCAGLAYMRYSLQLSLTPALIDLAFSNNVSTGMDNMNLLLAAWMLLALGGSILAAIYRWRSISVKRPFVHALIAAAIIATTNVFIPRLQRPIAQRIPYTMYYSLRTYLNNKRVIAIERETWTAKDAVTDADSLTVVLVLGESLRADHVSLNGYERETTPRLAKRDNLVSYPHVYCDPYHTHTSIPRLLTRADSINPNRAYEEESFIALFSQAGFRTSWHANQEAVASYVYFMNECDTIISVNEGKSLYIFDKWLDEDLLPGYDNRLAATEENQLLVLHTIGSHWWYNAHYSDAMEQFRPVVESRVIGSNSIEQMINSYDNTVLYTDSVLDCMIERLEDRKAIFIYMSDHGESLGENGFFLHAEDRPELHYPAFFVWCSDKYLQERPEVLENIRKHKGNRLSYDFLFHSILDAASISTIYKDSAQSICR